MTISLSDCQKNMQDIEKLGNEYFGKLLHATDLANQAKNNRGFWDSIGDFFTDWMNDLVRQFNEWMGKIQKAIEDLVNWLRNEVLPWVLSPFYLADSSLSYNALSTKVSTMSGRMAQGEIKPTAGWKGIGAAAYEGSRNRMQQAAVATATVADGLATTLNNTATNMLTCAVNIATKIVDVLFKITIQIEKLTDPTKWTGVFHESTDAVAAAVNGTLDIEKEAIGYALKCNGEVQAIHKTTLSATGLAGGIGWPDPDSAMTQPSVDGEAPGWDDV